MMLVYSGVKLPSIPDGTQPEDALTEFITTDPQVQAFYKRLDRKSYEAKVPANEFHAVNAYAVNLWLERAGLPGRIRFTTSSSMREILLNLLRGKAVVMSGVWSGFRHVVCVVGFDTDQDLGDKVQTLSGIDLVKVKTMIVDDPYGRYREQYQNPHGNDVEVPYTDFIKITNLRGFETSKWAYFVQ